MQSRSPGRDRIQNASEIRKLSTGLDTRLLCKGLSLLPCLQKMIRSRKRRQSCHDVVSQHGTSYLRIQSSCVAWSWVLFSPCARKVPLELSKVSSTRPIAFEDLYVDWMPEMSSPILSESHPSSIYSLSPPHGAITESDHGGYVVIAGWIMMCFFSLSVLTRLMTRFIPVRVYGSDDIIIAIAMVGGWNRDDRCMNWATLTEPLR